MDTNEQKLTVERFITLVSDPLEATRHFNGRLKDAFQSMYDEISVNETALTTFTHAMGYMQEIAEMYYTSLGDKKEKKIKLVLINELAVKRIANGFYNINIIPKYGIEGEASNSQKFYNIVVFESDYKVISELFHVPTIDTTKKYTTAEIADLMHTLYKPNSVNFEKIKSNLEKELFRKKARYNDQVMEDIKIIYDFFCTINLVITNPVIAWMPIIEGEEEDNDV